MNNAFKKIFSDLKPEINRLKKNDILFLQNDKILNMYFIKAGRLKLQRETIEGCSVIQHIAFKREVIAEPVFGKAARALHKGQ